MGVVLDRAARDGEPAAALLDSLRELLYRGADQGDDLVGGKVKRDAVCVSFRSESDPVLMWLNAFFALSFIIFKNWGGSNDNPRRRTKNQS